MAGQLKKKISFFAASLWISNSENPTRAFDNESAPGSSTLCSYLYTITRIKAFAVGPGTFIVGKTPENIIAGYILYSSRKNVAFIT